MNGEGRTSLFPADTESPFTLLNVLAIPKPWRHERLKIGLRFGETLLSIAHQGMAINAPYPRSADSYRPLNEPVERAAPISRIETILSPRQKRPRTPDCSVQLLLALFRRSEGERDRMLLDRLKHLIGCLVAELVR